MCHHYYTLCFILLCLSSGVLSRCLTSGECSDEIAALKSEINESSIETTRYIRQDNGSDTGDCLNYTSACKTLRYALFLNGPNIHITSLKINIGPGNYSLSNHSVFLYYSSNIILEGSGVNETTIKCGNTPPPNETCFFENIAFYYCTNIWIKEITFDSCGPYPSAHYIFESSNILLENNVYKDNTAPAIIAYLSSPLFVVNSHFKDNIVSTVPEERCLTRSNGLFYRDNVTSTGGISVFCENRTQGVLIWKCSFDGNYARNNTEENSIPSQLKQFGHGGGLSVRLVNSNDGFIHVVNSSFSGNTAEVGGGAISLTVANSSNNSIAFAHVTFDKNGCFADKCIGGAITVDLFAPAKQNKVNFFKCNFSCNFATQGSGGAISIASSDKGFMEDGSDAYKLVTIRSCNFTRNIAKFEGTAVGLFSLGYVNQAGFRIRMENCLFEENYSETKDISALTTYRVLVEVGGENNRYVKNIGGGVTLLNSRFDVQGRIEFFDNQAVFGGGFALSGRCLILLYENSSMLFEGNNATGSGAAIYVVYPSSNFVLPILNRGCFIQYFSNDTDNDLPPDKWKTKIEFVNNYAESGGSAIFTNDLDRCKWLNINDTSISSNTFIFNPPSGTITPFNLTRNLQENTQNATLKNLGTDPSALRAYPEQIDDASFGEIIEVKLTTEDDVGNFRQAVWSVNSEVTDLNGLKALSRPNSTFKFRIPSVDRILADNVNASEKGGVNISMRFDLFNAQGGEDVVSVRVLGSCHPGYYFDPKQQLCRCDISRSDIIRCHENGRYIFVKNGKWAYGSSQSSYLSVQFSLPAFLRCNREGESSLPGCLFQYDHPNLQCHEGREGDLCSQCKEGYGVSLDLRRCVDETCGAAGVIIFTITCLCFVAFSLTALFCDFTLPNELRGFIFYAQVIGLIYRNSPYVTQSSTTVDILVNLFGFSLPIPTCFTETIPALYVALLGLVPPLLVTLVTVIYVLSARFVCVKTLSNRTSIHGMVLLSLFVYKYVADTAFLLISCRQIHYKNEIVFQYDTTQNCFEAPMIVFSILALLTILLFVIPIPILILVTSKRRYSVRVLKQIGLFRDALNIGIKGERYWFNAWDIFRRIPFVATVFFATFLPSSLILLIQSLMILVVITVHCISKPYEKEHINVIEAVILGILFLSTIAILDDDDLYIGNTTSITLLVMPFIYALFYLSFYPSKRLWNKYLKKYYDRLRSVMTFYDKKLTLVTTDEMIKHEFVMVESHDAIELEEFELTASVVNKFAMLREPLLDDIN